MSGVSVRWRGPLADLSAEERRALLNRSASGPRDVRTAVAEVLDRVRREGDRAVREFTARFDRVEATALEVPKAVWAEALARLDPRVRQALERAARNIDLVHRPGRPVPTIVETEPGVRIERRPYPLMRVGVYVPGGRAAYLSSVLMGVVPAKAAGVDDVVVCSPPGPDGLPAPTILAAAALAGADRLFAIGGAQAIGAMAFGTETVPVVDRIVGPGNAYVMEAKLQVSDRVGIDSPAGPSEVLIIADHTSDPEVVAAELIAQAEHDPEAVCSALGTRHSVLGGIEAALGRQLAGVPREEIIRAALGARGALLSVADLDEAVGFANEFGAEHLLLAFDGAEAEADRFRTAGAVFVGASSSVVFGDYLSGANHVLPTGGLARAYSGLGAPDFFRWTTYQTITPLAASRLAGDTAVLAEAEGLPGHARAAERWGTR